MKKGLKTHIWGPNKKKEKSKQKHRSQVRELLTNTWFLGGDKPQCDLFRENLFNKDIIKPKVELKNKPELYTVHIVDGII